MNYYKVSEEDVKTVLEPHGLLVADMQSEEDKKHNGQVVQEVYNNLTDDEKYKINSAGGHDLNEQQANAFAVLERVLKYKGVITSDATYFDVDDDESEVDDAKYAVVEIREGNRPRVTLYKSREEAARNAVGEAARNGYNNEDDELYDRLMNEEDGMYEDGDVTAYVVKVE